MILQLVPKPRASGSTPLCVRYPFRGQTSKRCGNLSRSQKPRAQRFCVFATPAAGRQASDVAIVPEAKSRGGNASVCDRYPCGGQIVTDVATCPKAKSRGSDLLCLCYPCRGQTDKRCGHTSRSQEPQAQRFCVCALPLPRADKQAMWQLVPKPRAAGSTLLCARQPCRGQTSKRCGK